MDDEQLRRELHRSANDLSLPHRSPEHAGHRAAQIRRRRVSQGVTSVVALIGVSALGWSAGASPNTAVILDQIVDGDPTAHTQGEHSDAELDLHWETVEDAEGVAGSHGGDFATATMHGDDGLLYAVSTAPGSRAEDYGHNINAVPQALYRSADGVEWEAQEFDDGPPIADIGQREGHLYALSTGLTESGAGQVGISTDQGESWSYADLPSRASPPAVAAELGEPTVSGALAMSSERFVATVRTSYPVVGGVFDDVPEGHQMVPTPSGFDLVEIDDREHEGCIADDDADQEELRAAVEENASTYVVAEGDTYAGLAEEHLGDESYWQLITDVNGAHHLSLGDELTIPDPSVTDMLTCDPAPAPAEAHEPAQERTEDRDDNDARDTMDDPLSEAVIDQRSWEEIGLDGPEDLQTTEVFISTDSTTWERLDTDVFEGGRPKQIVSTSDGFVAWTVSRPGRDDHYLWHSDDGLEWEATLATDRVLNLGAVGDRVIALTQNQGAAAALTSTDDPEFRWREYNLAEALDGVDHAFSAAGAVGPLGAAAVIFPADLREPDGSVAAQEPTTSEQILLTSPDGATWSATSLDEVVGDRREMFSGWMTVTEDAIALHEHVEVDDDEIAVHSYVGTPTRD